MVNLRQIGIKSLRYTNTIYALNTIPHKLLMLLEFHLVKV